MSFGPDEEIHPALRDDSDVIAHGFARIYFVIADSMICTMLPHVALQATNVTLV